MKTFVLMHMGFRKPTPEEMEKWRGWFAAIAPATKENIGFAAGREIGPEGTRDLPWDESCITGLTLIEAESLDAAERLAASCPFVSAIRIYETRGG